MKHVSLESVHPHDWRNVKRKALVKKIVAIAEKAKAPIQEIHISPAYGSVYIEIGLGCWDEEYECFHDFRTIRIADHERTSNGHAYPDVNVYDEHSFQHAMPAIIEICMQATGATA